jgi:hypothetical protein
MHHNPLRVFNASIQWYLPKGQLDPMVRYYVVVLKDQLGGFNQVPTRNGISWSSFPSRNQQLNVTCSCVVQAHALVMYEECRSSRDMDCPIAIDTASSLLIWLSCIIGVRCWFAV